ncbi:MAG: hypothetical protein AAGF12_02120 [Myxococcota bacterium]
MIRDTDADSDELSRILLAVGYQPLDPFTVWLAGSRQFVGDQAEAAIPLGDRWDLRVVGHVRF